MYVSRKQLERLGETLGDVSTPSKFNRVHHGGGGKGDAPDVPDYTALANIQAQNNLAAIKAQTAANRVNQYTPYGNLVYTKNNANTFNQSAYDAALNNYNQQMARYNSQSSGNSNLPAMALASSPFGSSSAPTAPNINDFYTGGDDTWSANITLSPEQQQMLDLQNQIGISSLGQVQQNLSKPFDTSTLPAQMINAGQTAQDAIMSRLQPAYDRQRQQMDAQLANQGIGRGTEAYNTAQQQFGQQLNDAYINAALQGINVGNNARQQALNEQLTLRNEPLNALNALRSASQVQNPSFINPTSQGLAQTPDLLGAAQNQYSSQLGAANAANAASSNFMSGLMGLGATIGTAGTGSIFGSMLGF